ncbi:right-handed parallel beta-helix repeat-containing protein [Marinoscillum furvescens]|uniref:Putative secreted protein (Por secretion system target) n=1 Tax=Marinoscillum furvescens DSM 4134 TaxID=1122208 RepID=A0A3D9KZF5_MARFU|nr:right-handed parallel beta-helix repeat-containing protein [Marinoscillum furvescens]RED95947.1 putative secreted protein (Por secretion system target) [Marinoscillum furvescens DSM 4134]
MIKQAFSFMLLSMLIATVYATDLHVAKNGNDSNSGSAASPYLTIQKAANVAQAGDVVIIHAGTYRETVEPLNSGSSGSPITFTAAAGEKVIVSANEEINTWTLDGNGIYRANVTLPLGIEDNALFYDGDMMELARWPNNTDNDPYTPDANYISGGSASSITYSGVPNYDWSDGYIWYLGGHSGTSWTRKITSASTSQVNFTAVDISKWPFNPHNPTITRNGHKGIFYLFNSKDALDIEREYYYNASTQTVYFKAPGTVNPSAGECEYRARQYTFKLSTNHIVIDGIQTFGGIVLVTGNHNTIRNSTIRHGIPILDELDNTDAQIGRGSVTVEGSNTLIERNLIENGTANGISMLTAWKGSTNIDIRNNIIRNFNTLGIHAEPIRINCPGAIIENNTIYKGGRSGIYVSGKDAVVAYNDVYDVMKINADGGVFYTVGNADRKNSEIHHNWFHSSTPAPHAGYKVAGIYLDNHSKGYKVYNNVVYNVSWTGLQINWDNWFLEFYNNSIYTVSEGMGRWENGYTMDSVVIINNYASAGPWIGTAIHAKNTINASDPFTNLANFDFVPASGSYLVDAGTTIPGYTDGYSGSAPDIGAYERGGVKWIPGADWTPADDTPTGTVTFVNAPTSVVTGADLLVEVNYTASTSLEVVAIVDSPTGTWLANDIKNVAYGSGTITLTVSQGAGWSVDNDYKLGIAIRPIGGDFSSNIDYQSTLFDVIATPSDSLAITNAPSSVQTGDPLNVTVSYSAASSADLIVAVLAPGSGTWLASEKVTINQGTGDANFTINQSPDWAVADGYTLRALLRDVNGDWTTNRFVVDQNLNVTSATSFVSFQNQGSFNYMSIQDPNKMSVVGTVGNNEKFEIIDAGGGLVALKGSNGLYVSSENGTKELTCTRTSIGGWEKFEMVDYGNGIYALKGNNNQYLRNNMLCTSPGVSTWQQWLVTAESSPARTATYKQAIATEQLSLFPNPLIGGNLTIKIPADEGKSFDLAIFDPTGRQINAYSGLKNDLILDKSDFKQSGIYLLQFQSGQQLEMMKLIVK